MAQSPFVNAVSSAVDHDVSKTSASLAGDGYPKGGRHIGRYVVVKGMIWSLAMLCCALKGAKTDCHPIAQVLPLPVQPIFLDISTIDQPLISSRFCPCWQPASAQRSAA